MFELIVIVVIVFFVSAVMFPFVVYVSVKLGVWAYLNAHREFDLTQGKCNGEKQARKTRETDSLSKAPG